MELGTVSFIFLIIWDEANIEKQDEFIIEEKYCLFKFTNNDELLLKVREKIDFFRQENNKLIFYQGKFVRRKFIGTRKFCSVVTYSQVDGFSQSVTELAYSLFYTDKIENAKRLASGYEVKLDYYDYGNYYLINDKEDL